MKPLRDQFDPSDPNQVAGALLLARVPPLEPSTERKRRVRITLQATLPRRSARIFSPILVAGLLLIAASGASATVSRLWRRSHPTQVAESTARTVIDAAPRAPVVPAAPVDAVALETKLTAALTATEAHPAAASAHKVEVAPKVAVRTVAPKPLADPNGPGTSLMVEAMQARKAGDATRAAALLGEYERKYPQGALQEEALALSIESAAAQSSESASRLAADYLRRFPNGRFRELAQRAQKSSNR